MPSDLSPNQLQRTVQAGFQRLKNFRAARLMFIRNYTGQYYDRSSGDIGTEALNMIFNAVRTLVPNIVMNFPRHRVESKYLAYEQYADLLGLALSQHDKSIKIKEIYRQAIVDAIFTLGTLKTGLAESDSVYAFDEYDHIDTGEIYTACVDFDNFVVDPESKEHLFRDAQFIGDRMAVARQTLLDSGLYNNSLIERLPSIKNEKRDKRAEDESKRSVKNDSDRFLREEVEIVELWIPEADAIVTVPGGKEVVVDDYLRVDDYYGPDTGPYTFLALTPPVSGNPLPVPMVGIWNDLHVLGNRMAKKIIDQAERQKDVLGYKTNSADDAQTIVDAGDGEAVAMDDPDSVKTYSLGGQQNSNEAHLMSLQAWFNQAAANPEALAGQRFDADSATEARILANNANVGLEHMKDLVYDLSAEEARKRAWYMHTDPFINMPLIRRQEVPAQYRMTPQGPVMATPARLENVQIYLTKEARRGDFLDFMFTVRPESMGRKDGDTQFMEAMDFAVKVIPAVASAAQTFAMLGMAFSPKAFLLRMAEDRGIEWMDEVFFDPEFQMMLAMQMAMGPQFQTSQGEAGPVQPPTMASGPRNALGAMLQNGQPGQVMQTTSPMARERQQQQAGANPAQRALATLGV